MENVARNQGISAGFTEPMVHTSLNMDLTRGEVDREYVIQEIRTDDEEMTSFLFTLGCYAGETVTIISKLKGNYVITIKDARYSIDHCLAEAIII